MNYKAEFEAEGKITEKNGKKLATFPIPPYFQGHHFAVDMRSPGIARPEGGPLRVEFILGSEFLLYQSDIKDIDVDQGYSNLQLGESITQATPIRLCYERTDQPGDIRNATLTFKIDHARIQRFVVEMPEDNPHEATRLAEKLVNSILEVLSFRKRVPLKIIKVEIFHAPSDQLLTAYVTLPFTTDKYIIEEDLLLSTRIPNSIQPLLCLYREAVNSSNPYHRLLCLYRISEGLNKVRGENSRQVRTQGMKPSRRRLTVPDNDLTKRNFPSLVGKRYGAFVDYVRDQYRVNLAHLNLDDYDRMLLAPGEVQVAHRIDYVNVVLDQMMRESMIDELKLMEDHHLQ